MRVLEAEPHEIQYGETIAVKVFAKSSVGDS